MFCGNAAVLMTYAIILRINTFWGKVLDPWAHGPGPKGPWVRGPRAHGPKGPFWEGRGVRSTAPVSKNNDFGILARLPAETVSAAAARTPPPHAPGTRMTAVKQTPSNQ